MRFFRVDVTRGSVVGSRGLPVQLAGRTFDSFSWQMLDV